jgi:para-aminobenzoate synthetase component 2
MRLTQHGYDQATPTGSVPIVRVLVVDNHDSFVFNLVQYLGQLGAQVDVWRNDDRRLAGSAAMATAIGNCDGVLLSPGPGTPQRAGASVEIVGACAASGTPLLGVCLGHQAIGVAFGATVVRAPELLHGKTSAVFHANDPVLQGLANPFTATRYHSLTIEPASVPPELEITAATDSGVVMAMRHTGLPIHGVQFHPESILTEGGHRLLANWLGYCGTAPSASLVSRLEREVVETVRIATSAASYLGGVGRLD